MSCRTAITFVNFAKLLSLLIWSISYVLISCTPDDVIVAVEQGTSIESFSLVDDHGTEYKSFIIRDSIIHIQVQSLVCIFNQFV